MFQKNKNNGQETVILLPEPLPKTCCVLEGPSGLWNYGAEGHSLYGNRNVQQDGKFSLE